MECFRLSSGTGSQGARKEDGEERKNEFMKAAGVTLIVRLGVFGIRPPGNSSRFHPCFRIKLISPAVKSAGDPVLPRRKGIEF